MKRILSTALAIVLFVGASQAQTTEKADRHHKGDRKEMASGHLNLTPEQKAKFQSLREDQKKELQALKKSGNATPEQRKAIHEKYRNQYQSILTPAQQEEMKKFGEAGKAKATKGRKAGKAGKRGGDMNQQAAFFKKELNLTTDQESKLKSIYQDFRTKSQSIRSNSNLSPEQKRTQTQSLGKQYMAQGKAVLTPEQAKKFEELKTQKRTKRNRN